MIRLAVLALLLPLAACGSAEEPEVVIDGVDPVQSDGDLTPDAGMAPEAEQTPASDMAPEMELEPDAGLALEAEMAP